MKNKFNYLLIFILLILDIISKYLVAKFNVHYGLINYTLNSGIAFGMFRGSNLIFVFIDIVFVLILGYLLFKSERRYLLGLNLILCGAIGNLIDRIFYSGVVDFIDLKYWYVFNLADVFIVIGVGLILLDYFIKNK